MASARKSYARSKQDHTRLPATEPFEFAALMADLLDGSVRATALHEVRDGQGRLVRLEYDDPSDQQSPAESPGRSPRAKL